MALTLATELANYAAGIGTQGATLKIDSANKRVGVGTTNPQGPEGSLQVGTGITFFGNTGIISAIGGKFSGDFTVGGTLTYEDVQNVNSSGVGTFSGGINVVGGGLTVTGITTIFGGSDTGNILQINGVDSTSETLEAGIVSGNAQLTATHASGGDNTCGFIFRTRGGGSTSERLRIDSSGTLTVGPSLDRLTVNPGSGSYDGDPTAIVLDGRTNDGDAIAFKIDRYDGSGDASTKLIVNYAGKVGIGTTIPSRLLDLAQANSTAYSATDFDQNYHVLKLRNYTNDKSVGMQFLIGTNGEAAITAHEEDSDGNTTLAFGVRGSGSRAERVRIFSGGQVAIATVTNYGNANCDDLIVGNRNSNEQGITIGSKNQGQIAFADLAGDRQGLIHYQHTDDSMRFMTSGATNERMRIRSDGLVGIATAVPEAQLTVKGDNDLDAPPNKYLYSDGHGIQIRGGESALDIVSSDDGSHASSVLLRSSSDGFAAVFNPTLNQLEIKYFVPSANDFTVHAAGNFVSTLNTALRIGSTGICTATQLFEESNRVATTGKAIAMAFIFG